MNVAFELFRTMNDPSSSRYFLFRGERPVLAFTLA